MNTPDFIVIGASKCGTSTLRNYLAKHPDIFMITKEIQFFSCDEIYAKGLSWYESLFETEQSSKLKGEVSNRYSMKEVYPKSVKRIMEYAPDVKLIYCVREPMSRIQSYWLEKRTHGGESVHYDFNTAVKTNRDKLVDSANYWQQINAYRSVFSDDQIHVVFFEDLIEKPHEVMRQCFSFLGVSADIFSLNEKLHLGATSGRAVPRNSLSKLRQYKIFRTLVKFIPLSIRHLLKTKILFKKVSGKPEWNEENRLWVRSVLRSDLLKFLNQYGKTSNFWKLEE